jgi:hypothetical protein
VRLISLFGRRGLLGQALNAAEKPQYLRRSPLATSRRQNAARIQGVGNVAKAASARPGRGDLGQQLDGDSISSGALNRIRPLAADVSGHDLGMVNRIVPLAELREASLKFAKRLSLISPEALYATKRAVNRVADAAGFRTALYAGLDVGIAGARAFD